MKRYKTIVVDPPWSYTQHWKRSEQWRSLSGRMFKRGGAGGAYKAGERGAACQYDCMSVDELRALPIGEWADDNAHLYLWTTAAFLRPAFDLMEAWGFAYKTTLVWGKRQLGMGLYFRNNTEFVLFGVRGKLKLARRDIPTLFISKRTRHSEKPDTFYDMVETASPEPRIDVFARRHRMGWAVYGNEVYSDIPLVAAPR